MAWNSKSPGIPDEFFLREEEVPITKEEVRSIIISKLRLTENSSVIDIGCGSGSITVELCLQCQKGKVFGVDLDSQAVNLTKKNLEKFKVYAEIKLGNAMDILESLPLVDGIVIGGTTGKTEALIDQSISKLNHGGRLVITTILIETMFKAMKTVNESNLLKDNDFTQIIISKGRRTKTGTMMLARNPVLVISATKI
ncbi:MAG TPA: precorrin-6Y C5,15-methyltransferase (decarboxylating) subunit CbiT [Nitrososphaeraceae archaeon]|jgi:cobalt-precorrin-6B (C15)-methyltransferase|nr:precorrin-6Y C5,15-methyltransferase (decarboxylating) subunit CbiT [Nitrososphaeraceae archaeon]